MKKLILSIFFSMFFMTSTFAVTPLDMKTGKWEFIISMGQSSIMEQAMAAMANLPEEQKKMAMANLQKSLGDKKSMECITKEDLKKMGDRLGKGNKEKDGCKFEMIESTAKRYKAKRVCPDGKKPMIYDLVLQNSKSGTATMTIPQAMAPMTVKMKWISSSCKGVK